MSQKYYVANEKELKRQEKLARKYEKLAKKIFGMVFNAKELDYWSQFDTKEEGYYKITIFDNDGKCSAYTYPQIIHQNAIEKRRFNRIIRKFGKLNFDFDAFENVNGEFKVKIINKKKSTKAEFIIEK